MKPEAIRNIAIVMAIAATVFLSQTGFGLFATSINRIIMVLFVVGIILFAYQYYRERPLQWLVIPEQKRNLIIACAAGIPVCHAPGSCSVRAGTPEAPGQYPAF